MSNRTKDSIAEVVGWEQWGGERLLRVKLREPYKAACAVMKGDGGPTAPPAETRTLSDRMFTLKELFQAVSDQDYAQENHLSAGDLQKLVEALPEGRGKTGRGSQHYQPGAGTMGLGL